MYATDDRLRSEGGTKIPGLDPPGNGSGVGSTEWVWTPPPETHAGP